MTGVVHPVSSFSLGWLGAAMTSASRKTPVVKNEPQCEEKATSFQICVVILCSCNKPVMRRTNIILTAFVLLVRKRTWGKKYFSLPQFDFYPVMRVLLIRLL
jgi:hypothetical protein